MIEQNNKKKHRVQNAYEQINIEFSWSAFELVWIYFSELRIQNKMKKKTQQKHKFFFATFIVHTKILRIVCLQLLDNYIKWTKWMHMHT